MAKVKFPTFRVAEIPIPPRQRVSDGIVDVLAEVWNEQGRETTAHEYLRAVVDHRAELINERLYQYDEVWRRRLAGLLLELADAIYNGAVSEFVE